MAHQVSHMLPALRDMFPAFPDDVLLAALDAHNNEIDGAIGILLEMSAEAADTAESSSVNIGRAEPSWRSTPNMPVGEGPTSQLPTAAAPPGRPQPSSSATDSMFRAPTSISKTRAAPPRKTWGQLRAEQQLSNASLPHQTSPLPQRPQGPHWDLNPCSSQHQLVAAATQAFRPEPLSPTPVGPTYIAARSPGAGAKLAAGDFPDLPPTVAGTASHNTVRPVHANSSDNGVHSVGGRRQPHGLPHGSVIAARRSQPAFTSANTQPLSVEDAHRTVRVSKGGGLRQGRLAGVDPGSEPPAPSAEWYVGPQKPQQPRQKQYAQAARQVLPAPGHQQRYAVQEHGALDLRLGDCGNGGSVADGAGSRDADWRAAALEQLCQSHGWAGRELVEAVCLALQYDLSEVVSALDELQAASYQDGDRSCSGGGGSGTGTGSPSSSGLSSCSPSDEEAEQEDEEEGDELEVTGSDKVGRDTNRRVAAAGEDFRVSAGARRGRGGNNGTRRAGWLATGVAAGRVSAVDGTGGGGAVGTRREGSRRRGGGEVTVNGGGDAYARHRQTALKLTHAWRKRMNKASAAFAAGDRALGRALVAEAQQLRQQAAAAHQEAAARIESEMNDGRQLSEWELDLHGLHGDEAVQALTRRIAALESASSKPPTEPTATPTTANRSTTGVGRAADTTARNRGSCGITSDSTQGPMLARPGPPAAAAAPATDKSSRLLASRRTLRVIVGKGLHSSGGEASLPRVVQSYLTAQGYRFTLLAGVIEVQLRRKFAAAAAAGVGTTTTTGPPLPRSH